MSSEVALLVVTAVLAVVAVTAAVVAVRAVRRLAPTSEQTVDAPHDVASLPEQATSTVAVRVVEGRVIATPTEQQVVAAAMGRPAVRASVLAAGLAHALRPESRDRIVALMRREYRHRRRVRQRVARRAARDVPAQTLHRDATWLGEPDVAAPRSLPRAVGE